MANCLIFFKIYQDIDKNYEMCIGKKMEKIAKK